MDLEISLPTCRTVRRFLAMNKQCNIRSDCTSMASRRSFAILLLSRACLHVFPRQVRYFDLGMTGNMRHVEPSSHACRQLRIKVFASTVFAYYTYRIETRRSSLYTGRHLAIIFWTFLLLLAFVDIYLPPYPHL